MAATYTCVHARGWRPNSSSDWMRSAQMPGSFAAGLRSYRAPICTPEAVRHGASARKLGQAGLVGAHDWIGAARFHAGLLMCFLNASAVMLPFAELQDLHASTPFLVLS